MKHLLLAVLVTAGACGGGDDSAFLGIYELDTWTSNDTGCSSEGDSILETSGLTHFYFKQVNFFGQSVLTLDHCVDLAECETEAADKDSIALGYAFDRGSDSNGWVGFISFGFEVPGTGTCDATVRRHLLEEDGADTLRVSSEVRTATGVPLDGEGGCDLDAAVELVEGEPCEELEVFTGTLIESI